MSVIVSTYNRFESLMLALERVRRQTHDHLEVIVVNDASSDPAYDHAPRNGELTWIDLPVNTRRSHGFPCLGHVRNVGIRAATGEYLAFLDDDDYWEPDKLARQLAAIHGTEYRMCSTEAWAGDGLPDARVHYPRFYAEFLHIELPARLELEALEDVNYITHSSVLLHRSVVDQAGHYPEIALHGVDDDGQPLVEDWEMWRQCMRFTPCRFLDEPLVYYDCKTGRVNRWSFRARLLGHDLARALGRTPPLVRLRHGNAR